MRVSTSRKLQRRATRKREQLRWWGRGYRRLFLETLEDRLLPSTINWTGAATGDWGIVANWTDSANVHRLPTSADDVFISTGNSVTHSTGTDNIHSLLSN